MQQQAIIIKEESWQKDVFNEAKEVLGINTILIALIVILAIYAWRTRH